MSTGVPKETKGYTDCYGQKGRDEHLQIDNK